MRNFASLHPIVLFIYYVTVIFMTMLIIHPIILLLSLLGSLLFYLFLITTKIFWQDVLFYFFVLLFIAVTNPIFVHKGETILFFLNENPVTLEAIIYGFVIASMLVSVIFWSKSYSHVMTSDKFIYLFGKIIPKLSLVISMALRFIPLFKQQIKKVQQAQKTLGLYTSNSVTDRILSGIRTFTSVISWSLEHAIDQADAMKARGYGLKDRSNFTLFKWTVNDIVVLIIILLLLSSVLYQNLNNFYQFQYYPTITRVSIDLEWLLQFFNAFILMVLPAVIEIKENLHWKYLQSKI